MNYLLKRLAVLAMLCLQLHASAQYKGGVGQGTSSSAQAAAALGTNFFKGGSNDGTAVSGQAAANLGINIFKGGADDGLTVGGQTAANLGTNIFKGGADDGITFGSQAAATLGLNIFKGGADDGTTVSGATAANLGFNISRGGADDGWAVSRLGFLSPLPVTLARFTGEWALDDALLKWETSTEINSDHFELQRSYDGRDFATVGEVRAAGESIDARRYQYRDERIRLSLADNIVYYRLKTVDRDGSFSISAVVILQTTNTQVAYTLFPNPARDRVTLQITGNAATSRAILNLYDLSGKLLTQTAMLANRQNINVSKLSAGTYIVVLTLDGKPVYNQKLIVQK